MCGTVFTSLALSTLLLLTPTSLASAISQSTPAQATAQAPAVRHEFVRVLMGVRTGIIIYEADQEAASNAAAKAFDRIAELDRALSDYQFDSELMRLCDNAGAGPVSVSADLLSALVTATEVSAKTDGLFDVRVGPLVALWREARRTGAPASEEDRRRASERAFQPLEIDRLASTVSLGGPGMKLDMGGIGKGIAAAAARDVLVDAGFPVCIVSMSGDIAVGTRPPPGETAWKLEADTGLGTPHTIQVSPGSSISTAGDVVQNIVIAGVRYSHIVDPRTGLGSQRRGGAVVVGTDGGLVDAVDDALYLGGVEAAHELAGRFPELSVLVEERTGGTDHAPVIERFVTSSFSAMTAGGLLTDTTPTVRAASRAAGPMGPSAPPATLFDPQNIPPAGFEALFNGKDLSNWQGLIDGPPMVAALNDEQRSQRQNAADASMHKHWRVENGVLIFDGRGDSLQTIKNYRDFELYVDWKIEKEGDSGIYLRGSPQVQIWDNPIGSGGLYNNHVHASRPLVKADAPVGEWNRFHIIMRGSHVTVYLNDVLVVDDVVLENYWEPAKPIYAIGPIELQNHGNTLYFRNIFVKELPPLPEAASAEDFRMSWWREARFGMFIHWGLYAVPAGTWNGVEAPGVGEWIMHTLKIPASEYEKLAPKFNPVEFDAERWVKMAAEAGVRYIVITSKHHDGFSLFDSKLSTYDVMDATPFKRDILKELAEACRRHGVRMCWYHSIMDWHHPDAQKAETFPSYVEVLRGQVRELLSNYGPIGAMWFDGEWDQNWSNEMGKSLYDLCRQIQPWTIVNNRVGKGRQGMAGHTAKGDYPGDFGTPEQEIPATGLPGEDWESCMTMNDTWGYKTSDRNWKSATTLVRMLIETTSKGGNFLLNVGPTAQGVIPPESVERFGEISRWMRANSASIYGCSAGPFKKLSWGRCTSRENTLYLHVFDMPADRKLRVPGLLNAVRSARLLAGGAPVPAQRDDSGWLLTIPPEASDPYSLVIEVKIDGTPAVVEMPIMPAADGSIDLRAADAQVVGHAAKLEGTGTDAHIGFWTSETDQVTWKFGPHAPGRYTVEITYACEDGSHGAGYEVRVGSQLLTGEVENTRGWRNFTTINLGTIELPGTPATLQVVPTSKPGLGVMNLRNLRLTPAK